MKNLIVISTMFLGLFGIVRAEEAATTTTASAVTVSGELSTDITFGEDENTTGSYQHQETIMLQMVEVLVLVLVV